MLSKSAKQTNALQHRQPINQPMTESDNLILAVADELSQSNERCLLGLIKSI